MSKVSINKKKLLNTTLVNIDSSFRNLFPKNICKFDSKILPNNPLTFKKFSNILTINYPDHKLNQGDNIVIQNIEGSTKVYSNCFYLIKNFKYLVIIFEDDILIDPDYKQFVDQVNINIEIFSQQTETNFISNIPLNNILGVKTILLANNIPQIYLQKITNFWINIFGTFDITILNKYCIFIELPTEFISKSQDIEYYILKQVFKITDLHIGGIKLGYLNSNYPINNYNYQSNYSVYNIINENIFEIQLNNMPFGDIIGGGKNIQVLKIINSLVGYPDADNYVINLKKSFNNVVNIELISTEFPYVDILVKKDINDKLYWKNIEDGDHIYKVQIEEGFYTANLFLERLKKNMNQLERINSTNINKVYNYFDIYMESNIHKIIFYPYNLTRLPNSFSVRISNIESELYYILNIEHPNNIVEVNDYITISSATDVTVRETINNVSQLFTIEATYLNKEHKVYSVNLENQTYDIILGKKNEVKTFLVTYDSAGGKNIIIKSKSKVSFIFDKIDTIGELLGFKNVGDKYSITDFKSEISNQDPYIISNNLNSVGNEIDYTNGFFNMTGKYNYFLMYLNDIEYIYSNNNLPSAFAKILLSGNPGDILFNTFVPQPQNIYSKSFPISTLTELTIKFIYPDGNKVNFRNINHSFTLKITEEKIQNDNTYLNSQNISVADEFRNAKLN